MESLPNISEQKEYLSSIPGVVPAPGSMPTGCRFAPRCSKAHDKCSQNPPLITTADNTRVQCWLYDSETTSEVIRNEE
jgi:peptide/nickel transport system ATP-binding protein